MRRVVLPPSPFQVSRELEVRYTHHGDLGLGVAIPDASDESYRGFVFSHGSEAMLMATFIQFATLLDMQESTNAILDDIQQSIRAELPSEYAKYGRVSSHYPLMIARGAWSRGYLDNQAMGWYALADPIVSQPGVLDEVGGTGIYTREDVFGNQSLLLATIPSRLGLSLQESPRDFTLEFYKDDIEPVLRTLGNIAMGDYQKEIFWLIEEYLQSTDE